MVGLLMDGVPLAAIADAAGTPTWVYSAATMRARYRALTAAMADAGLDVQVHYAVKANDSRAVLPCSRQGAGADVVSGGELLKARAGRHPGQPHRLFRRRQVRAGTAPRAVRGHRPDQRRKRRGTGDAVRPRRCLGRHGAGRAAGQPGRRRGHQRQDRDRPRRATNSASPTPTPPRSTPARPPCPGIEPIGLATHIGSQILALAPYRDAFARIADLVRGAAAARACGSQRWIAAAASAFPTATNPRPPLPALPARMKAAFHNLDVRLAMEPGRWLVGPAGVLLASVVLVKQNPPEPLHRAGCRR